VVVHGMEAVEWSESNILVSNHISGYDIFALAGVMPGRFAFVAKKELESIPFFGTAWKAAGHISIDRSDRQKAIQSLRVAAEKMHRDHTTVIIFAEGTRSRSGELMPFKKGAFVLAQQAGVPIVPVVIRGSDRIQKPNSLRITPNPVHLHFCAPILTAEFEEERVDALMDAVRSRMVEVIHAEVPVAQLEGKDGASA
jgi:1-acyl-sn-glycerol-3-phosphate acyltransferase